MSSNVRRVDVEDLVPRFLAQVQGRAVMTAGVVEAQLETLLEHEQVKGDHRLQVQEAMAHLKEVLDMLGPVEEFEQEPQPVSAEAA